MYYQLQTFYKGRLGTIVIKSGVSLKILYLCIYPVLAYMVTFVSRDDRAKVLLTGVAMAAHLQDAGH